LQAAVSIAQSQKARSFELRAALSLAKLYRAANRGADVHAVLAPAAEGFPADPTISRAYRGANPSLCAKPLDR
jgi:predicted ATPase